MEHLLDLLEELLSITEQFKPQMESVELRRWQSISAECADIREGTDGTGV